MVPFSVLMVTSSSLNLVSAWTGNFSFRSSLIFSIPFTCSVAFLVFSAVPIAAFVGFSGSKTCIAGRCNVGILESSANQLLESESSLSNLL